MRGALIRLTAYGLAALVGALFSAYGLLAAASHAARNYPTS